MRENALPILERGVVDLVLNGHSHNYERSCLLAGHYGFSSSLAPEMLIDDGDGDVDGDGAYRKRPRKRGSLDGTVYVVVGDRLDAAMIDGSGQVRDRFTIVNGAGDSSRTGTANGK